MASWDAVSFLRGVFPTILFVPLPDSSDLAYPIWKVWENLGKPMRRKSILPLVSQQSQNCAASARWKSANANHRPHTHLIISTKHVKQFSISIQARCLHRKKTRKAVQEKRVRNENVLASGRSSWVQPSNQTKPNQTAPHHSTPNQATPILMEACASLRCGFLVAVSRCSRGFSHGQEHRCTCRRCLQLTCGNLSLGLREGSLDLELKPPLPLTDGQCSMADVRQRCNFKITFLPLSDHRLGQLLLHIDLGSSPAWSLSAVGYLKINS